MSGKRARANVKAADGEATVMAAAAKAERKLLDEEKKAERRLEDARARLAKAEDRLRRRQTEVEEAEQDLRARQAARATGPVDSGRMAEPPHTAAPPVEEVIVLANVPAAAPAKPKRKSAGATGTVLLSDGSTADGAGQGDPPAIVTPGPSKQTSRRRKTPAT
jgi:hypothetical protein